MRDATATPSFAAGARQEGKQQVWGSLPVGSMGGCLWLGGRQLGSGHQSRPAGNGSLGCGIPGGIPFFKAFCNNSGRCSVSFLDNLFPAAQHAYLLQTDWQDEQES